MSRLEILTAIVHELNEISRLRIEALNARIFGKFPPAWDSDEAHVHRLALLRQELEAIEKVK